MGDYNLKQVNVLISTYNGEKYLEEQVESIANQTYGNIKIFIRDDGSTDHTIEHLYFGVQKCAPPSQSCVV